jgi:hypothetical protein
VTQCALVPFQEAIVATLYQRNGQYCINYSINGRRIREIIGKDKQEAKIIFDKLRY